MALGYDLVVIGSGPGSHTAACRAARRGMNTALVAAGPAARSDLVLAGIGETGCWADLQTAMIKEAAFTAQDRTHRLEQAGVQVIDGQGLLDGPNRVLAKGERGLQELSAPRIILAPSSVPSSFPRALPDGCRILFPRDLLRQENLPPSLTVVGAGTEGYAWASILAHLGCSITLVEVRDQVLPGEDDECAAVLAASLEKQNVRVLTGHRLAAAESHGGGVSIQVKDLAGNTLDRHETGAVLLTLGHRPAHHDLNLKTVKVVQDRQGHILTDLMMQTATPGLYAIGDAVPSPRFQHLARREAEVAVAHAAGQQPEPLRYHLAPRIHFGPVQLGAVGFREVQALAAGHLVTVGKATFSATSGDPPGIASGGMVKVVVDAESDRVLGVHLAGPRVAGLLPEATTVVGLGAKVSTWARALCACNAEQQVLQEAVLAAAGGRD